MTALYTVHSAPLPQREKVVDPVETMFENASLAALLGVPDHPSLLGIVRDVTLRPMSDVLRRRSKRFRARLVELGWQLAGATGTPPNELAQVVELIHGGSIIVDDIEDGSLRRRGEPALHVLYGVPLALNTGNLMYFLPLALLRRLDLAPAMELALYRRVGRTMIRAHFGQALDVGVSAAALPQAEMLRVVRASTRLKTGSLMGLAASLGGIVAGGSSACVQALARFGARLGVVLQMCDDLGNLSGGREPDKRCEDLRLGRPTWVWAWLARDLRGAEFAFLQRQAAAVQAGDAAPEPLAERLTLLLDGRGREEVRARLRRALADLRRTLGDHAALSALADECARLEASYG